MSIVCYTGLPGEGKSYSAVENFVIPALKEGRHVSTNLILNVAALSLVCDRSVESLVHMFPKECTPDELIAHCPSGAVVVVDEVWNYWPAGTAVNEVPKHQVGFFKEHRHRVGDDGLSTEICIIDQDPQTGIPAFLRALIELTYLHSKHSTIGVKGRFRVDVYSRCQSAEKPKKGALVRSLQGRYKPEVWNCYISHTQSKRLGEAGLEKAVDTRANIWKGWTMRSAVAAIVLLPFLAWMAFSKVQAMVAPKAPAKAAVSAPVPGPVPAATVTLPSAPPPVPVVLPEPEPVKDTVPKPSTIWRVVGVITRKDGTGVALIASATGRRRVDLQGCQSVDPRRLDWHCTVDGELVTPWSGTNLGGSYSAAAVPGSISDSNALPAS